MNFSLIVAISGVIVVVPILIFIICTAEKEAGKGKRRDQGMINSVDSLKEAFVKQGYVPDTCTISGEILCFLINGDKDPCDGCTQLRSVCKGRQKEVDGEDN